MRSRPSLWMFLLMALGLGACATGPDVDGVWHAVTPTDGGNNALLYPAGQPTAPLGVELVLGAYGPDLAGLMRYYRSAQFDLARSPLPPRKECECAFLHQAKVDATGRVTFVLDACVPGTSPDAPLALRGELTLRDDGRLVGTVSVDDPSQPTLASKSVQLAFVRVATAGTSDPAILDCQHPVDVPGANTTSGL